MTVSLNMHTVNNENLFSAKVKTAMAAEV
jgi:hypothetical protein